MSAKDKIVVLQARRISKLGVEVPSKNSGCCGQQDLISRADGQKIQFQGRRRNRKARDL